MAEVRYTGEWTIGSPFPGTQDLQVHSSGKGAVYTDNTSGSTLTLIGRNLAEDPAVEGTFTSGRVEKAIVRDSDGDVLFKFTEADYKAIRLGDAFVTDGGVEGVIDAMFRGNDTIFGSSVSDTLDGFGGKDRIKGGDGSDYIWGGRGNDRHTGGAGSDSFSFVTSEDGAFEDVINDLDIEGGVTDSLYIDIGFAASRTNGGDDTLLTLDNGGTILLKDVEKTDFMDWWNSL